MIFLSLIFCVSILYQCFDVVTNETSVANVEMVKLSQRQKKKRRENKPPPHETAVILGRNKVKF